MLNKSIVVMSGGLFLQLQIELDSNSSDRTVAFFENLNFIVGEHDPITPRLIPECVDEHSGEFVLMKNIGEFGIRIPIISDIEACYFDEWGIPEVVEKYYRGVAMLPYSVDNVPNTVGSILLSSFIGIKKILIL